MYLQGIAFLGFAWVKWHSRHGLSAPPDKRGTQQPGVCSESTPTGFAPAGLCFCCAELHTAARKGELDLVGFDGATLAVVEVRTRQAVKAQPGQPDLSITKEKHGVLPRAVHYFLRERHIPDSPVRFDGVVMERHTRPSSRCAVTQSASQSAISTAFPMKTNRILVTRFP